MYEKIKDIFKTIYAFIKLCFMEPLLVLQVLLLILSPLLLVTGAVMFCFNSGMWGIFMTAGLVSLALFMLVTLWWYFFV